MHLKYLTNMEVANALYPHIDKVFRYDVSRQTWYIFRYHVWVEASTHQFRRFLMLFLTRYQSTLPHMIEDNPDPSAMSIKASEKTYQGFKRSLTTANMIRDMDFLSQSKYTVQQTDFDANPILLACENGVYNLQTKEFRPGDPDDMITKKIPVKYDPGAVCPLFNKFLVDIMPDADIRKLLQQYLGLTISGDTTKYFLILFGRKNNGKTTLVETVGEINQPYRMTMEPKVFMVNKFNNDNNTLFFAAKMQGMRLVVVPEIQDGKMDASTMKRWCGQDQISARQPAGKPFDFFPTAKFVFYSNKEPEQVASDEGLWTRLLKIDFPNTFEGPNCDTELKIKLLKERAGILNWLIDGYSQFVANGHKLDIPESVIASTRSYRDSEDIISQFISERCIKTPNAEISIRVLHDSYASWCDRDHRRPIYINNFAKEIGRLGLEKRRKHDKNGDVVMIKGITFNPSSISCNAEGVMDT